MSEANDISAMSFEAAVAELERIVEQGRQRHRTLAP